MTHLEAAKSIRGSEMLDKITDLKLQLDESQISGIEQPKETCLICGKEIQGCGFCSDECSEIAFAKMAKPKEIRNKFV